MYYNPEEQSHYILDTQQNNGYYLIAFFLK